MTTDADPTELPPLPTHPDGLPWPDLLWPYGPLPEHADEDRLEQATRRLFARRRRDRLGETHALLVVHRGRIVAERYQAGVHAASSRISWSMAKSMLHAAVGILVAEGRLDLDHPVAVPEWTATDDPRHAITLRQLLQFRDGLSWVEEYVEDVGSDVLPMLFGEGKGDMAAFAAARPPVHPPGEVFNYSSGTSNIVSRLVRDSVGPGPEYEDFLRRRLFGPAAMASATPRFDDAGTWIASSYVHATARDFARFGYLYLRDGVFGDRRILPEGWVDFARTESGRDDEGRIHGAHWWLWGDDQWGAFHCAGYEGQYIIVVPTLDLVVVRLGQTVAELRPNLVRVISDVIAAFDPT